MRLATLLLLAALLAICLCQDLETQKDAQKDAAEDEASMPVCTCQQMAEGRRRGNTKCRVSNRPGSCRGKRQVSSTDIQAAVDNPQAAVDNPQAAVDNPPAVVENPQVASTADDVAALPVCTCQQLMGKLGKPLKKLFQFKKKYT